MAHSGYVYSSPFGLDLRPYFGIHCSPLHTQQQHTYKTLIIIASMQKCVRYMISHCELRCIFGDREQQSFHGIYGAQIVDPK